MTPKEKAADLFSTYRYALSIPNAPFGEHKDDVAKNCALIAVDQILDEIQCYWLKEIECYWQEVKQEIENKSKMTEQTLSRAFVNVYQDEKGRFISDLEYNTLKDALDNRDKLNTYVETLEVVRTHDFRLCTNKKNTKET